MGSKFSRRTKALGPPKICLKGPPVPPAPGLPPIESLAISVFMQWTWTGPPGPEFDNVTAELPLISANPWIWYHEFLNDIADVGLTTVSLSTDSTGLWFLACAAWAHGNIPVQLWIPPTMRTPGWGIDPISLALTTDNADAAGTIDALLYMF